MGSGYRLILEKGVPKLKCPNCDKKTYVRYIDTETNKHLSYEFGRCDREVNCGYFNKPSYKGLENETPYKPEPIARIKKPIAFIPEGMLYDTLKGISYSENKFLNTLPFDSKLKQRAIDMYLIGTRSKGETTFPFIDKDKNIRAIQIKSFDENLHTTSTNWIHTAVEYEILLEYKLKGIDKDLPLWIRRYKENEKKVSCLFGEHLLNDYPHNPIGLVEAPKTAIVSMMNFGVPDSTSNLLWMAVFNLSSLNYERLKVLEGRKIILFPDLSKDGKAFSSWNSKAEELRQQMRGTEIMVSDFLEVNATDEEKEKGYDIADYILKQIKK